MHSCICVCIDYIDSLLFLIFVLVFIINLGLQNSKFLQFVSKMSRGELIIDDNQVKPATSGDWAAEYQQQYSGAPSWADEFARDQASIGLFEA